MLVVDMQDVERVIRKGGSGARGKSRGSDKEAGKNSGHVCSTGTMSRRVRDRGYPNRMLRASGRPCLTLWISGCRDRSIMTVRVALLLCVVRQAHHEGGGL